jgi:hypothetical protein
MVSMRAISYAMPITTGFFVMLASTVEEAAAVAEAIALLVPAVHRQ